VEHYVDVDVLKVKAKPVALWRFPRGRLRREKGSFMSILTRRSRSEQLRRRGRKREEGSLMSIVTRSRSEQLRRGRKKRNCLVWRKKRSP
jgi:hypothetical protein